jgi:hypothetical protein
MYVQEGSNSSTWHHAMRWHGLLAEAANQDGECDNISHIRSENEVLPPQSVADLRQAQPLSHSMTEAF